LREKPAGTLRLAAGDHAAETILWPAVEKLRRNYPDVTVEIDVDNGLTDIVAGRYHAGVRLGERVDKDMIAVRISPDQRMAVVGAPSYFTKHPKPRLPKDLTAHACINLRLPTFGGFYVWEFEKSGKEMKVRVEGPLAFNSSKLVLEAALAGCGLACLLEDRVKPHLKSGGLIRVLADWCRAGRIDAGTVAAIVVPVWMRTLEEIRAPFEASSGRVAGLELESAELFRLDNPYWDDDPAVFARSYVRSVTAWGGPMFLRAFAREGEDRAPGLLAAFLGELEERVADAPNRYRWDYVEALLVCRKTGR